LKTLVKRLKIKNQTKELLIILVVAIVIAFLEIFAVALLVMISLGILGISLSIWEAFIITFTIRWLFMKQSSSSTKS
jgi:uncharacterized membrane-anchored protein YitT (DUF2179 family)